MWRCPCGDSRLEELAEDALLLTSRPVVPSSACRPCVARLRELACEAAVAGGAMDVSGSRPAVLPDVRPAVLPDVRRGSALSEGRSSAAQESSSLDLCYWRRWHRSCALGLTILKIICILLFLHSSLAYKCRNYNNNNESLGEIVPRHDIKLQVGEELAVFCNYNSTALHDTEVIFKKVGKPNGLEVLPSERVNSSSIRVVLSRSEPDDFLLFCFTAGNSSQNLCWKKVSVGYVPLALENFTCVSPNWKFLNCTWTAPFNPVKTTYTFAYFVPDFLAAGPIKIEQNTEWFVLEQSAFSARDSVTILVSGNNSLGVRNFTYSVDVYSVVVPSSPRVLNVTAVGPDYAEVEWELDHLMDAFPVKLRTELAWRIPPSDNWTKSVSVAEYDNVMTREGQVQKRKYRGRLSLPYPHQQYEVRVRMHTSKGAIRDQFWSQPAYTKLTTNSTPPDDKVAVDPSCYETKNSMLSRDIFVYWRDIDPYLHNGPNFHYQISARDTVTSQLVSPSPLTSRQTYVKFPEMAQNVSYSFEIRAVNDEGSSEAQSSVVVPARARMPAVPHMFTVIKYKDAAGLPLYRLMWTPPAPRRGADWGRVERYTLFWCPRAAFDLKCEEKLEWTSTGPDLESLELRDPRVRTGVSSVLYERNMTGLAQDRQFGIAAVTAAGVSSGIKWATCSVPYDDSPPAPQPPEAVPLSPRSVRLQLSFECRDRSAGMLSVKISYCEVDKNTTSLGLSNCVSNVTVEERPLSESEVITGLRPSSQVIFWLSIVSVVGTSRNSDPVNLTLPEDVPSGPPEALSLEGAGNTSLSLRWQPPLPAVANGDVTHYVVTTFPLSKGATVPAPLTQVTLSDLSPFTAYNVSVAACTRRGCSRDHPALIFARTLPGLPSPVDLFLNSIDGVMSWEFPEENCHSAACSFDVRIVSSESVILFNRLEEYSLSLRDVNMTCEDGSSLNVSIRAVGVDAGGTPLPGPWRSKEGPCTLPPVTLVPWWIWVLVVAGILVPFICFACAKCGLSVFLEMTGPVKVPDLKSGELKNSSQKKLKPDTMSVSPTSGQVLFNSPYASLSNTDSTRTNRPFDVSKRMPLLSQSSVNSDGDHTEESGGRHLSGSSSSGGSSEADSALASIADGQDSASASSHGSANSSLRQSGEGWPPLRVPEASPAPYVLHGQRPAKVNVCEGYVAVRSDLSLHSPHLPDIDGAAPLHFLPIKPPISIGFSNSAEPDQLRVHPNCSRRSSSSLQFGNKNRNFTSPPDSNASSPLPAYSRHSFTPPGQPKYPLPPSDTPTDLDELRCAAAAFNDDLSRLSTPESVNGQQMAKQRPASIPSILSLEKAVIKNDLPDVACGATGAYSVVGKRKNVVQPVSSSQGYVTLSSQVPRPKFPSFLGYSQASTTTKDEVSENSQNCDISSGFLNSSQTPPSNFDISHNYCTLEDLESLPGIYQQDLTNKRTPDADNKAMNKNSAKLDSRLGSVASDDEEQNGICASDRWAFSNPRPRQLDFADEVRFVASAPIENHRGRKYSQKDNDELHLPNVRPNTSDGVAGRTHNLSHSPPSMWITGAPSLSKQSSGYVSQEALSTEPLVISPKRLFAHSQEIKSSKSIPQEVSFV